ncbi:nucleotidyltransferase family protein [Synechococcus sp. CS-205]|uniref:nucleotidyltransferase family protein n=1 Tax=Synechococcus sp. CS-205 TaxID=2847984 RepID=UPI00223C0BCD|nr:nucleotidyltransferase family protein [Synechococcus sp. CS-205]
MRLAELQRLAPQLHELLARHGASNPAVFGSVARDQATPGSDVDLLVDLPAGASLFDRVELKTALEDLLLTRVDLIRRRNLKPELKATVEAEAITL